MEIYLARISQRDEGTLYVERKQTHIETDPYVAISHVWGHRKTNQQVHIEGVGPIMLSLGKRDLLPILYRPDSNESPINISNQLTAIPAIYRHSIITVALTESPNTHRYIKKSHLFDTKELHHARKCSNLVLMDPWFDRLWTRQEGLYATKLRMVILNEVECCHFFIIMGFGDLWLAQQQARSKREAVSNFILDKMSHHWIYSSRGSIRMLHRSSPTYMPIREAWRSGRIITKTQDYVLAVFPDGEGYYAPPGVQDLSFSELLMDAYEQIQNSATEAYDPIISVIIDRRTRRQDDFAECTSGKWDQEVLRGLFEIWKSNANLVQHMVLLAPSGPCVGSPKIFKDKEQHGVAMVEELGITSAVFERELKLFLICLICGTILACAVETLKHVEVVIVVADDMECGEMLSLVSRSALSASSRNPLILRGNNYEESQGFLLLSAAEISGQATVVVGRTMIPKLVLGS
ncbi:hypothetical protein F4814DRAFT_439304 [Daldinia grandis]|nr:hypothetical protein F4814DRAFT_439304 [Daldinia grandis]